MTPDTIAEFLVVRLRDDAQFVVLSGASGADTRIYAYYEPDSYVDHRDAGPLDKPGYVTMALVSNGDPGGAVPAPVFSWAIWGRSWATVVGIRNRIHTLMHKQRLVVESQPIYTKVVNENDSSQAQTNYRGRTMHVRAGYLEIP